MANDDRSTVRPPPGNSSPSMPQPDVDPLFIVQLYYPNNAPVGHALASHIRKRSEDTVRMADRLRKNKAYAGRRPDTTVYEKLQENLRGVIVNALIVGVDEFCDLDELFQEIERYFAEGTPIIVHVTAPTEMELSIFVDYGALGAFAGYNFSEIDNLLDQAAREDLSVRDMTIDAD
jgi:hypothetical protein